MESLIGSLTSLVVALGMFGLLSFIPIAILLAWIRGGLWKARLWTVKGTLDVLGQHQLLGESGVKYTTVRFLAPGKKYVTETNVLVPNHIYHDLVPGLEGKFCFYRFKGVSVLCGATLNGNALIANGKLDATASQRRIFRLLGTLMILFGIPMILLFLLGVPLIFIGLFFLFVPISPTEQQIADALQAA